MGICSWLGERLGVWGTTDLPDRKPDIVVAQGHAGGERP